MYTTYISTHISKVNKSFSSNLWKEISKGFNERGKHEKAILDIYEHMQVCMYYCECKHIYIRTYVFIRRVCMELMNKRIDDYLCIYVCTHWNRKQTVLPHYVCTRVRVFISMLSSYTWVILSYVYKDKFKNYYEERNSRHAATNSYIYK